MTTTHPFTHPITGAVIAPLGWRKDGRAIWPVLGGDDTVAQPPAPAAQPAPSQPAAPPPPAAPAAAQQPPVPTPPPGYFQQQPPAPGQPPAPPMPGQPAQAPGDPGFPANTPWRDMTGEQQVAYWQHQSRKHEQRVNAMADYEQLKTKAAEYEQHLQATQTEQQRAVAEARRQGAAEALAGANNQIVEQWVRSAAHGRLAPESVDALLAGLNRAAFVTDGQVDTARVWSFVSSLAPAPIQQQAASVAGPVGVPGAPAAVPAVPAAPPAQPPQQPLAQGPDFGQGQGSAPPVGGLERGREIAQRRFAKQQTTKPTVLQ